MNTLKMIIPAAMLFAVGPLFGQVAFTNISLPGPWPAYNWWETNQPPADDINFPSSNAWWSVEMNFRRASNAFNAVVQNPMTSDVYIGNHFLLSSNSSGFAGAGIQLYDATDVMGGGFSVSGGQSLGGTAGGVDLEFNGAQDANTGGSIWLIPGAGNVPGEIHLQDGFSRDSIFVASRKLVDTNGNVAMDWSNTNGVVFPKGLSGVGAPQTNISYLAVTNAPWVTAMVTNGLATTNWVEANYQTLALAPTTNGFVGAGVTNGLATTNWVGANYQTLALAPTTNGFVGSGITNGLATTNWVGANYEPIALTPTTNGFIGQAQANAVTNGFPWTNVTVATAATALGGWPAAAPLNGTNAWTGTNTFSQPTAFTGAGTNLLGVTLFTNGTGTTAITIDPASATVTATTFAGNASTATAAAGAAWLTANQSITLTGDVTGTGTTSISTTLANTRSFFGGNTGGSAQGANVTYYYAPNNTAATNANNTADGSGATRIVVSRQCTLKNLYIVNSASPGSGKSVVVTIMTNGTASSIVATATAATTGNDTSHTATIIAGVEVGIKLVTSSGGTPVKTSWGFEAD